MLYEKEKRSPVSTANAGFTTLYAGWSRFMTIMRTWPSGPRSAWKSGSALQARGRAAAMFTRPWRHGAVHSLWMASQAGAGSRRSSSLSSPGSSPCSSGGRMSPRPNCRSKATSVFRSSCASMMKEGKFRGRCAHSLRTRPRRCDARSHLQTKTTMFRVTCFEQALLRKSRARRVRAESLRHLALPQGLETDDRSGSSSRSCLFSNNSRRRSKAVNNCKQRNRARWLRMEEVVPR